MPQTPAQALFLPLLIPAIALVTALVRARARALVWARALIPARAPEVLSLDLLSPMGLVLPPDLVLLTLDRVLLTLDLVISSAPVFLRGSKTRHQTSLILAHGNGTTAVCHATNPGNLCKSQNPESEGHGNPQRWRGNLSSSVKHVRVASVSFTTGMKREPPTTWIKSRHRKMALRVTSSDTDTRGCSACNLRHPCLPAPPRQTHTSPQEMSVSHFEGSTKLCWRCSCTTRSGLRSEEVRAEQEPPRKLFEAESVTHHDYRAKLVQTGPPAPTKPHDYRQEQPETFWTQRAPQLPGVSNIRTLDTPFRKNCSFSTPVPLSLGQPLPYELESFPHQMGVMSSLSCQGGGQGCGGPRTAPA